MTTKRLLFLLLALIILSLPLCSACSSQLGAKPIEKSEESVEEKKEEEKTTTEEKPLEDPAKDGTLNVLMIGNSFSTYFSDEILGLAKEKNLDIKLYNVYYSGCRVQQHWEWYMLNRSNYILYEHISPEEKITTNDVSLKECLAQENWDIITLQQHFSPAEGDSYDTAMEFCGSYTKRLCDILRGEFPMATLMWHQTWAYEVGHDGGVSSNPDNKVLTVEKQTACYEAVAAVSKDVCEQNSLPRIPSGDAWQIARANPIVGDTLCQKTTGNDKYHDGDVGGGQYLNACVWFEVLTGESCIGNTWRPDYNLAEEKIPVLQRAAHEAVAAL